MANNGYGMSCFNCDETLSAPTLAKLDAEAVRWKWMIGLMASGQAYYGCPNCGPVLYGASRLRRAHFPNANTVSATQEKDQ